MPLLHKAPYQFRSVPQDLKDDDEVFHIRATKEVFKTYEEYIAKAQLYTKEVWSCSLTGKSNLTLEEALEAEESARKKLEKFPVVLEKPTLLLAHHSQKNLDWMATTLTNQYKSHCVTGEIVTVLIGEERKTGKILECVTSLDADEGDEDMYRYKIILLGTGEQLSHIPHHKLERKLQMPSKELIKMFIREHTNKQSNMFNVKKDMLLKYNIPHKFATITSVLRTPSNVKNKSSKKGGPKMINSKPSSASKSKPTSKTPATSKPTSAPKMIKIHSVGEDGRLVTTWKEVPSKTPVKSSPVKSSPIKSSPKKSSPVKIIEEIMIISDSDSPNNSSDKKNKTPGSSEKPKKPPLTEEQKREKKKKRVENLEIREFTNKVKTLVEKYKDQITPKQGGNSATPTKGGMKQTSLLSYTNRNSISSTIREIIEAEDNGYRRSLIVNDLAKSMTTNVSEKLPLATPVKSLLLEKREKLLERERLAKMTLEQREKYIREKEELRIAALQKKREEKMAEQQRLKEERMRQREIEREAARQARLAQQALERIIIDDLSLEDSKQLPPYIPVDLPEGISPGAFPKLALVADAIHFFKHIFTQPEDDLNYNSDLILQASLEGPRGHKVLSNLLISMLQTLGQELRDKVKIPQLEVPLSTVDLSEFNVGASVLVYITYLLQQEEYEDSELDDIAQALQRSEFYDLTPTHKIHVLFVMCNEIFKTGTFNAAIQENIDRTTQLRKRIQAEAVLRNKQRQDEKLKLMQDTLKKGLGGVVQKGEKSEEKAESEEEEDEHKDEEGDEGIGSEDEDEEQSASDLASAVKRRQEEMKKKKEEEREEREKQEQEKIKERKFREQQAQIEIQRKKEEQLKSELENRVQSMRNEPLGMDRNYARYWLFSGTSGLYIEQGWWGGKYFSSIEKKADSLNTSNTSETSEDSGVLTRPEPVTIPPNHPPCWYVVPTLAAFDELKSSLNKRGVREKALLATLTKEDERIRAAIRKMNYPSRQHRLIGSQEMTIKGLKKDVMTMDSSLGYAGLGGLDNISKLMKPDLPTVDQISTAMLALQETVEAKYLKKPMCSHYNPTDLSFTYHERVQKWRDMVEGASTYSDLHMLLSILDNCVKWERSLDNIKCKSCQKKGDERKLLICDVCDTGYHCGCLRPPLKKVPEGDWLCPDCTPVIEKSEENSSDSGECSEEEQDEDEENDDYCCVCEQVGELILCDKCPSAYHLTCHDPPLKRIPRGDWACYKCQKEGSSEEEEEEDEESEEQEPSDDEVSNCSVCSKGGKLLVCAECEETYHMKCHDPPVKTIPSKRWKCSLCKPVYEPKPKKRSSSNSSKGRAGKKRKIEKSKPRSRVEELKSEDDEETTETEEDEKRSSSNSRKGRAGKKRKIEKSKPRPRIEELKSEDDEETTATETEEDEERNEEEEEEEEEQDSKRSSRSKSNAKGTGSRKPARESRSRKGGKEAAESREERSNRRSLKRGLDDKLEICEEIVSDLLKIPESADFIDLVDKKKVPDYYDLIERPICLSQIKEKTLYLQYENCEEFIDDMLTLFQNCFSYNLEQSEVYDNGRILQTSFLSMLKSRLPRLHRTVGKSRKSE